MRVKKRHPFISSLLVTWLLCIFGCDDTSTEVVPSENVYKVTTLAGNGQPGFADGFGTNARFRNPVDLTIDEEGNLFVSDRDNHRIRKITAAGDVTTLSGNGEGISLDGALSQARFENPQSIAFDLDNNLLIGEKASIRNINLTEQVVSTITGNNDTPGYVDGSLQEAAFNDIRGIAVDKFNHIYVTDHLNHVLRKITTDGQVTTFAGDGIPGIVNGLPQDARFNHPSGMFMTKSGLIVLADEENNLIRQVNNGGVVEILAGSIYGYQDGVTGNARFRLPAAVTEDEEGNIYVADARNFRIRIINKAGVVETIAGNGIMGFNNAMGDEATFGKITGIAVDKTGNIYVVDQTNHCIRKLARPSQDS